MGGQIRIAYREESGKVHTRTRWTNRMGIWLKSHHVAARDHNHMMQYFGPEERVDHHKPPEDDTDKPLAPHHYGIVLVDFQANQIMSAQNYTSLERISPAEATGYFYRPESRADSIRNFTEMADYRLRVRKRVYTTFQQKTSHIETLGEPLTNAEAHVAAEEMLKEYREQHNPFRERADTMETPEEYYDTNFQVSFDPLDQSLLSSDDDTTSLLHIKTRMDETGFVFTPDEQMIWDQEIRKAMERKY